MAAESRIIEKKEKPGAGDAGLKAKSLKIGHLSTKDPYLSTEDKELEIWKLIS